MKYTFRQGPLTQGHTATLTDSAIQLLRHNGKLKRSIDFADVRQVREFSGVGAIDERDERFNILHCKIVPQRGRSITLISSSYLGRGRGLMSKSINHEAEFRRFVLELKRRVAAVNPDVPVIVGHATAAVLWLGISLLGIGLLVLGALASTAGDEPLSETWQISLGCIVMGLFIIPMGWSMSRAYKPQKTRLAESLGQT